MGGLGAAAILRQPSMMQMNMGMGGTPTLAKMGSIGGAIQGSAANLMAGL